MSRPELRVLEGGRRREPEAVLYARAIVLGLLLAGIAWGVILAVVLGTVLVLQELLP